MFKLLVLKENNIIVSIVLAKLAKIPNLYSNKIKNLHINQPITL